MKFIKLTSSWKQSCVPRLLDIFRNTSCSKRNKSNNFHKPLTISSLLFPTIILHFLFPLLMFSCGKYNITTTTTTMTKKKKTIKSLPILDYNAPFERKPFISHHFKCKSSCSDLIWFHPSCSSRIYFFKLYLKNKVNEERNNPMLLVRAKCYLAANTKAFY